MSLKERVYSVLLVSSSENFNKSLTELLPESNYYPLHTVSNISSAKRAFLERSFDFIIINAPLPDDMGVRFAIDVCKENNSTALLFVKNDIYPDTYEKVVRHGVFTLSKPVTKQMISQSLDWMCATRERLRKLEVKTSSIEDKMKEIRLVNRAKWILIDVLKMSEADAHRYIEKQAMDSCITRREVSENIIKTYT